VDPGKPGNADHHRQQYQQQSDRDVGHFYRRSLLQAVGVKRGGRELGEFDGGKRRGTKDE